MNHVLSLLHSLCCGLQWRGTDINRRRLRHQFPTFVIYTWRSKRSVLLGPVTHCVCLRRLAQTETLELKYFH